MRICRFYAFRQRADSDMEKWTRSRGVQQRHKRKYMELYRDKKVSSTSTTKRVSSLADKAATYARAAWPCAVVIHAHIYLDENIAPTVCAIRWRFKTWSRCSYTRPQNERVHLYGCFGIVLRQTRGVMNRYRSRHVTSAGSIRWWYAN